MSNIVIKKITHAEIRSLYKDQNYTFKKHVDNKDYNFDFFGFANNSFLYQVAIDESNKTIASVVQYGFGRNNSYWMYFVSTLSSYQNQGLAKKILEAMMVDLAGKTENLYLSRYEDEGLKLIPTIKQLAVQFKGQVNIFHKTRGTEYQNALYEFIKLNDIVLIEDENNPQEGMVIGFKTHESIIVEFKVKTKYHELFVSPALLKLK